LGQAKVKVVYFAQARELAGIREDDFLLTSPASVKNLFSLMLKAHPEMGCDKFVEALLQNPSEVRLPSLRLVN
jgi:molybdopterin converting factor small subunit